MVKKDLQQRKKSDLNQESYHQQVLAALAAGEYHRKYIHGEVQRRLTAIKTTADELTAQENYATALPIYEALVNEIIEHFNDYRDEYVAFCVTLLGCIDGLDSCFAAAEDDPEIRLRVMKALFAIYHFYTRSEMDLDEDIPGLLVGNTTPEERQIIAGWVRDALARANNTQYSSQRQNYSTFLATLEKDESNYE